MVRGQSPRLTPELLLNIELSSICSRNRYTDDPAPVIAELQQRAGRRTDILAEVAGLWAGYYRDEYTRVLADALLEVEGAETWVTVGTRRRNGIPHHTPVRG